MNTKPSKRTHRWLLRCGLLGLLLLGWGLTACLPASYSIQIHSVQDCSGTKLSTGSMDVSVSRYYKMRVELANWLTVTGNPAQFAPETNYIEVSKAVVYFDYPSTFTTQGDALYKGEGSSRDTSLYARLEPSVVGSFDSSGASGQAGAVTVNSTVVEFPLITPETAKLWESTEELKPNPTSGAASTFSVIANVRFIGKTGTGSTVETPMISFPLIICKGCMDNSKGLLAGCRTGSSSTGGSCIGQDGFCLEPITKEQNP